MGTTTVRTINRKNSMAAREMKTLSLGWNETIEMFSNVIIKHIIRERIPTDRIPAIAVVLNLKKIEIQKMLGQVYY